MLSIIGVSGGTSEAFGVELIVVFVTVEDDSGVSIMGDSGVTETTSGNKEIDVKVKFKDET